MDCWFGHSFRVLRFSDILHKDCTIVNQVLMDTYGCALYPVCTVAWASGPTVAPTRREFRSIKRSLTSCTHTA